jgi:hypothetical protein
VFHPITEGRDQTPAQAWRTGIEASLQSVLDRTDTLLLRGTLTDMLSWQVRTMTSVERTPGASWAKPSTQFTDPLPGG